MYSRISYIKRQLAEIISSYLKQKKTQFSKYYSNEWKCCFQKLSTRITAQEKEHSKCVET